MWYKSKHGQILHIEYVILLNVRNKKIVRFYKKSLKLDLICWKVMQVTSLFSNFDQLNYSVSNLCLRLYAYDMVIFYIARTAASKYILEYGIFGHFLQYLRP